MRTGQRATIARITADHTRARLAALRVEAAALLRGATFADVSLPSSSSSRLSEADLHGYYSRQFDGAFTSEAVCAKLKKAMLDFEAGLGEAG